MTSPTWPTGHCCGPKCLNERIASPFLSFRPEPGRLFRDIVEAIEMIEQFTSGMEFEDFRTNPMVVAAVERKIQIISEAAISQRKPGA